MIRRFFQSRGARKFRNNRMAMFGLSIIMVYFVLALWMMAMDALNWVGKETGAYDLYEVPVMSTFLPKRMLMEVGPPMLGGLGRPWGKDGKSKQVEFYFSKAKTAVETIEDSPNITPENTEKVLNDAGVLERRLADTDFKSIERMVDEIQTFNDEMDLVLDTANTADTIGVEIERCQDALEALNSADDPEVRENQREEVGYALADISYAIEDFQSVVPESIAFQEDVVDRLAAASDAYLEPGQDSPDVSDLLKALHDIVKVEINKQLGGASAYVDQAMEVVKELYPEPKGLRGLAYRTRLLLGTDRQGRSILLRTLFSAKIAIQVGFVVGLTAVIFGSVLGAAAAFFGGWIDHLVAWLYSTFSSIPQLVLLAVLSFMFLSDALSSFRGLPSLYFAFAMTFWIGPCRVIRGEAMKIKELEYVQAATAIGFGRFYILLRHIIPNTMHLMFINFSLLFIGAIKGEVILTFLGLGLPLGSGASWGIMISQSKADVVSGFFWQIGAATAFMFVLVLAFNIVSDALQDAFDPKHVS